MYKIGAQDNRQTDTLTNTKDSGIYKKSPRQRTRIMGIINITPDSFSGDGMLTKGARREEIIRYAQELVSQGADIIDIGGESSRPGAASVSVKEELKRTIPVIEGLVKKIQVPISIDTYKPEVARCALESGASIVNDITGLRNLEMIKVVAESEAGVVVMHMKGMPSDMQDDPEYTSLIEEIIEYLQSAINKARDYGISKQRIIIDPGLGFGKTVEHNLEILRSLDRFKVLGFPVLVGTSRKSFIGKVLNVPVHERLIGTVASLVVAVINGADIVRVHNVNAATQALKMVGAILNA